MKKNNKLTEEFINNNIKINASFSSYPIRQLKSVKTLSEVKEASLEHDQAQMANVKS